MSTARAAPAAVAEIVVAGQVRAAGAPLARTKVELLPVETNYEKGRRRLGDLAPAARVGALSDAAGRFRIVAPESGMWRLVASAPGYVPMEYPLLPLTDDVDLPAVDLPRDAGLQIRVVTDKAAPFEGARVLATPFRQRDAYAPWKPTWEPAEQLGITDVKGRVLLAGNGDSLRVEARAPGHLASVVAGTRSPNLEVRLLRGLEQSLLVRDGRGRPAAGAQAWIENDEIPAGVSDPQGRLSLALPAGKRLAIRFLAASGDAAESTLLFRAEAASKPVTVDLRSPERMSGRVLSLPDRLPVPGALVWLGRDVSNFARADRAGAYSLALGSPGPARAAATGFFEDSFDGPPVPQGPSFGLRPKAFLAGSVVDERGRPLAGVEIRARYDAGAARRPDALLRSSGGLVRSRETGLFRADRLVPGAAYELRFARDGFAPRVIQVTAPEAGMRPDPLRVVLSAGLTAGGRVLDRQNRPVSGARVELQPTVASDAVARIRALRDPDPALSRKTSTDGTGRFEILNLAAGAFDLSVRAAGFAEARIPRIEIQDGPGPVDLGTVMLEGEAAVRGLVRSNDGRPVEGAEIRIVPSEPLPGDSSTAPDALSDAAGRFEIRSQRPGARLKLSAEKAGYAPAQVSGVTAPSEEPILLVLSLRGSITGRVVDADSRPVAGAVLRAASTKLEMVEGLAIQGGSVVEGRSRDDGTFVIEGVEPGPVELTASGAEWQESSLQLRLPAGQNLDGVELVLHEAALVEGRVLGPDGTPVARAEIGRHEPPRPGEIRYRQPLAVSDAEGHYRIDGLAPGRLSLAASHPTLGQGLRELDAQPGDNAVDFELAGGQTVSGKVLDPSGSPVADARVSLRSSSSAGGPADASSEADGSFHFEGISPGSYRLEAGKEGEGRTPQPVPITVAEAPLAGIVLELASLGTIRGRILGLTVDELAQVQVSAGWGAGASAVGYDGTYRIADLAPGAWKVVADLPRTGRRAEGEVTLEPETDAELDLDFGDGLTLTGRLRKNGRALAGATVTLRSEAAPAWTETGPEGLFELRGLVPGAYRLEVSDYRAGILLARQIQIDRDQNLALDLDTATLEGIVLDERERQALGQVELTLTSLEGGDGAGIDRRTVSSADGTFAFTDMAAGAWRLKANRPGYTQREQVLSLSGTSQRLEVVLDPAAGAAEAGSPR